MIKRIINKKAITPLMASLLLLSFSVALGVFFMNLGRAQIEASAVCPIKIGLTSKQFCLSSNQVNFQVQNGLTTGVKGLIVNVIGTEKAETFELDNIDLAKGGIYSGQIVIGKEVGSVRQVKVSPKIILYDHEEICIEKAVISESLGNC